VLAALFIGSAVGHWTRGLSAGSATVTAPAVSIQSGHASQPRAGRESDVTNNSFGGLAGRNELAGEPVESATPGTVGAQPVAGTAERDSGRGPR
jgi:type IV secretory pathway TrbL component